MSMLLTFLMVFTTVMPYTAFAEDSVLTDGAGDMELVGVSSGANGTEAEIVDASGDGESSLITDQADASSASGAQGPDSSAASGAGSDGSADASLDGLFEDEPDAASTDTAASEDTGAANTYLNEDTRTVYLVNRNSYADLQLWNENKTGDEADFWVQHVEKPGTDKEYDLYGSVTTDENGDVVPTDYAGSTSYRFEEIKLEKTEKKDAKGGDIYSADIPESWEYVVFSYFADDADLKEDTKLDDAGYPVSTASNGRHRTMVIKVDDKKTWTVMVPFSAEEKTEAGIDDDTPAWTNIDIEKTTAPQAFYVDAEHYEDADGKTYRTPMVERLDGKDDAESETAAETAESTAETVSAETGTAAETAESTAETASAESETAAETTTEAAPAVELVGTSTNTAATEAGTEAETETETEATPSEETEAETASDETETETVDPEETESETQEAGPGGQRLLGGPRKAPAATQYYTVYFLNKPYNFSVNNVSYDWSKKTVYVHAWNSTGEVAVSSTETVTSGNTTAEYAPTDSGVTLYKFQIPTTATNFMFYVENYAQKTSDLTLDSSVDGYCYYVNSGSQGTGAIIVNMNNSPIASTNGVKKNTPSDTLELTVNGTVYTNDSSDTTNAQIDTLKTNGVSAVRGATISASVSKTGSDYTGASYSWTSDSSAVSISDASSTTPTITADDWGFANITLTITKSGDSTETITFPVTVGYDATAQSDVISMNPGDVVMFYDTADTSNLTWSKTGTGAVGLSAENGDTLNKKTGASVTTSYDAASIKHTAFYVKALEAGNVTLTSSGDPAHTITITVNQDTSVTKTVAVDSTIELSSADLPLNDYYYDNSDSITWTVSDTAGATISSDGTSFGQTATTSSKDAKLTIKGVSDKVVTVTGGNYVITVTVGAGKPAAKTKTVYFWCKASTTFDDKTWWTTNVGIQGSKDNGNTWVNPTDDNLNGFKVGQTYTNAPDGFEAKVATDYVDIAPNAAVLYEFTIPDDWTTIRFVSGGSTAAKDTSRTVTPEDGDVYYLQSVSDNSGSQSLTTTTVNNLSSKQSDGYRHLYRSKTDTSTTITLVVKKTTLTLTADMDTILVGETTDLMVTPSPTYTPEGGYSWKKAEAKDNASDNNDVIAYDDPTQVQSVSDTNSAKSSVLQDSWDEEAETPEATSQTALVEEEDADKTASADADDTDSTDAGAEGAAAESVTAPAPRKVAVPEGTTFGTYAEITGAGNDNELTVKGTAPGYAKIKVTAADKYAGDTAVESNEVTLQVVNARLLPDSATIDLQNTPSGDAVDTQFQVQVGDIPYTDVVWTLTPDNGLNSTTNYSAAEKTALTNNVTVTAAGTGTDSLVATVKAVNGTNMPTTGKMTLTATLYNNALTADHTTHDGDTPVWTKSATVTVLTYPTTDGYFYIDTTLSRVNQAGAGYTDNAIPSTNSTTRSIFINYYDANSHWINRVEVQNNSSNVPTVQIGDNTWKYTYRVNNVPTNAKYIQIGSNADVLSLEKKYINATAKIELPASDSKNNCYYLDDADPLVYWGDGKQENRRGYWAKAYTIRKPDDENTANKSLDTSRYEKAVDNAGSLTRSTTTNSLDVYNPDNSDQKQVAYWANSSFYDYYSDIELNGMNRSKWFGDGDGDNTPSHRTYSTFRQLDQALSDYYSGFGTRISYPLYTGHFQPNVYQGIHFADIESSLNLYGWSNYNAFMSTNNSTVDLAGGGSASDRKYDMADQGLVGQSLSGGLTMANGASDTGIPLPYFSSGFLAGNNSKNMVLGKTYSNVAFPFTRYDRDNNGVYYYVFDSAQTTLHMENGFLTTKYVANYDNTKSAMENASTWNGQDRSGLSWSKNTDVTGGVDSNPSKGNGVSNTWGFFPLNATDFNGPNAAKNNYGFGCKLTIPFKLNTNGDAITYDANGNKTGEVAQSFTFSGDDDVWVFIDGQLVLDMGGDHGRVSGCINFSSDNAYNYEYYTGKTYANSYTEHTASVPALSTFVSQVKKSPATGSTEYASGRTQSLAVGNLADGKTHTLTMYYMERGQWESNMKVEFSYIPTTTVNVEKKFISDGNDVTEKTTGSIYVCLTRKPGVDGKEELVPLNESGTSARTKYCKKISSTDEWKGTFKDLTESATVEGKKVKYIYSVHEVVSTNGRIATDGKDAAGVYKPKMAAVNDTITMNGTSYTLSDSTTDAATGTTTLTNTHTSTTSVKVQKRFDLSSVNNSTTYLPGSIKIKLQRAVGSETITTTTDSSTGKETEEKSWTEPASTEKWTDVAVDGQGDDGWYELKSSSTTPDSSNVVTWSKTFPNLAVYPDTTITTNDDGTKTRNVYFYRVVEYSGDANTGAAADTGTVLQDGKVFTVYYSGDNNGKTGGTANSNTAAADKTANIVSATLTNKPMPTQLTIKKVWSGTDKDTRPTSIKIKVQRAELSNYDNSGKLTLPTDKSELAKINWSDLSLTDLNVASSDTTMTQDSTSKWITWTPGSSAGTTWTQTFSNLPIAPANRTSSDVFYVYRIIEAANGNASAGTALTAAENGGSATYKTGTAKDGKQPTSSYFVRYSTDTVSVTRTAVSGSNSTKYTYTVNTTDATNGTISAGKSTITNTLQVHLPSTGSRTGLTLTILSLICLAAAGSFGIFGRKRRLIA